MSGQSLISSPPVAVAAAMRSLLDETSITLFLALVLNKIRLAYGGAKEIQNLDSAMVGELYWVEDWTCKYLTDA